MRAEAEAARWEDLEAVAGTSRAEMAAFAELLGGAKRGVLVWSMGVTQHAFGEDNVRAIVNLALARGLVGREGMRADADPRALRRPGRRRDGLLRDGVPGRRGGDAGERRRRSARSGASTSPASPASSRRR